MKILVILNDPPYGTERSYNGLRLAKALQQAGNELSVFLLADAVVCAKQGQEVPSGFYNIGLMLGSLLRKGRVRVCGTCMKARGLSADDLLEGAQGSTMDELAEMTEESEQVLVF